VYTACNAPVILWLRRCGTIDGSIKVSNRYDLKFDYCLPLRADLITRRCDSVIGTTFLPIEIIGLSGLTFQQWCVLYSKNQNFLGGNNFGQTDLKMKPACEYTFIDQLRQKTQKTIHNCQIIAQKLGSDIICDNKKDH